MPVHSPIPRSPKSEAVMPIVQAFGLKVLPVAEAKENSSARDERAIAEGHCQSVRAKPWQIRQSENYSSVAGTGIHLQQEPSSQAHAASRDQSQNQTTLQSNNTREQNKGSIAKPGPAEIYRSSCQPALVFRYYVSVDARRMVVSCHCVGRVLAPDRRLRFERTFNGRPGRRSSPPGIAHSNCYGRIGVSLGPR